MRNNYCMRTTVNLDPSALSILKSLAIREQRTLGEVLNRLIFKEVELSHIETKNGFPVLPNRVPGAVLTTEDVLNIMEQEGI